MDNVDIDIVAKSRKDGHSYGEISKQLKEMFPYQRGFSERTVRRYCKKYGLEKMNEDDIDEVVSDTVEELND
jgi:hypothetical protein